jgi:hypothetical protein
MEQKTIPGVRALMAFGERVEALVEAVLEGSLFEAEECRRGRLALPLR